MVGHVTINDHKLYIINNNNKSINIAVSNPYFNVNGILLHDSFGGYNSKPKNK